MLLLSILFLLCFGEVSSSAELVDDMQNKDVRRIVCHVRPAKPVDLVEARRQELRATSVRFRQLGMRSLFRSGT